MDKKQFRRWFRRYVGSTFGIDPHGPFEIVLRRFALYVNAHPARHLFSDAEIAEMADAVERKVRA